MILTSSTINVKTVAVQSHSHVQFLATLWTAAWASHVVSDKEPTCQFRRLKRHRLDPWIRRSPGGGLASHSSSLAWRIPMDRGAWTENHGESPWTEEPGGPQFIGSQRVGHD